MQPLTLSDFQALARERLPAMAFDYFAGGAEAETTLRENELAWGRLRLRPRMLVDTSQLDVRTRILGQQISFPVLTAPCGFNGLAHPDGDLAVARAVAAAGTLQVVSTAANHSLEEIASAVPGPRWFQLYVYKDRAITRSLVERAEAAGYSALCVTIDVPLLGRRLRDIRNHFAMPPGLSLKNLEQAGRAQMGPNESGSALSQYVASLWDGALTWEIIDWLHGITRLPLVVKGVLTAEDAEIAVAHGVAAIVVSNHGGRQLDGVLTGCEALPEVVAAVAGRAEILVDGGIRRGTDVLKALALGARAVLIGRPYLWALAVAGEEGVRQVLALLRAELELAMVLSGRPTLASIDSSLLAPPALASL